MFLFHPDEKPGEGRKPHQDGAPCFRPSRIFVNPRHFGRRRTAPVAKVSGLVSPAANMPGRCFSIAPAVASEYLAEYLGENLEAWRGGGAIRVLATSTQPLGRTLRGVAKLYGTNRTMPPGELH
jgi:hypothetical protein